MGAQSTLRKQPRLREGGKLHDEYQVTTTPRHRDIMMIDWAARIRLSCLAPRARDLAGGLVRSPVPLLARPAAVPDTLARAAHAGGAIGAARVRAAAALASPGRACARTRGSGARRRAALKPGGKSDGLRRDRHGQDVGGKLVHGEVRGRIPGRRRRRRRSAAFALVASRSVHRALPAARLVALDLGGDLLQDRNPAAALLLQPEGAKTGSGEDPRNCRHAERVVVQAAARRKRVSGARGDRHRARRARLTRAQ